MKPGEPAACGWFEAGRWFWVGLGGLILFFGGCAADRRQLDEALLSRREPTLSRNTVADAYIVGCPDVLEVSLTSFPHEVRKIPVDVDGRVSVGGGKQVRVEGLTVQETARVLERELGVAQEQLQVRVATYRSQQLHLFGPGIGSQRAVPYQGSERVVEMLQRVGGITPGSAPGDIHVIRYQVAEGLAPEVFHVDLPAILLRQDERTNITLQPFDQIYVGQRRSSCLESCCPPWLRPVYEWIWGLTK
jgi:protein involved in polysaccharide export with SLBB domain